MNSDFIQKLLDDNPFKGESYNIELYDKIMAGEDIEVNTKRLFFNNIKLNTKLFEKHNYGHTLEEIISLGWLQFDTIIKNYDKTQRQFGGYYFKTMRGHLQYKFNYEGSLIHVPVMKKEDMEISVAHDHALMETLPHDEQRDPDIEEMAEYIQKYKDQDLTEQQRDDMQLFMEQGLGHNVSDLRKRLGCSRQMIINRMDRFKRDFIRFYKRLNATKK